MKIKLKPWDEVVRLGKERDYYDALPNSCYDEVFGLDARSLHWGCNVEADEQDSDGDYVVHDLFVKPWMIDMVSDDCDGDILRYGRTLTDDQLYSRCDEMADNVRIRLIAYDGRMWYHKMVNGTVAECRQV